MWLLHVQDHTAHCGASQSTERQSIGTRKDDFIQTKMVDYRPKEPFCLGFDASFFYRAERRKWEGKVKEVIAVV